MMKRIVLGVAMAGALTLWTSIGSLAHVETAPVNEPQTTVSVADATSAAADATSAVNTCEAAQVAAAQALEGQAVAAGKDAEAAKELAQETAGTVQEIAASAREEISSALADLTESVDTDEEDAAEVSAPTLDQFKAQVDGIATAACEAMAKAVADAQAEIAGLEAVQTQPENDNGQVADNENDQGQAAQTSAPAEHPETNDAAQPGSD